jgi:hypothetical protein
VSPMSPTEIRYETMSWQAGQGLIADADRRLAAAKTTARGRAVTV